MGHIYIYIYYGKRLRDIRMLEKKLWEKLHWGLQYLMNIKFMSLYMVHGIDIEPMSQWIHNFAKLTEPIFRTKIPIDPQKIATIFP